MCRKGKEPLILKAVTIIDPITRWFEVTQYSNKKPMTIKNFLETMWQIRYPCPVEITYEQGGEFLGHEFKNSLIENKYGIKTKTSYPNNPQANAIIEIIHPVLGNLLCTYNLHETYVYDTDPWMVILMASACAVKPTYHRNKQKVWSN